ncbi:hypothetical protein DFJ74DRAFT_500034 [Hyaloraphidium curvatum]|nr:hypothetical protein DFJ74DRAFT_500034 [Hyaloraphidium curvatum]
MLADVSPTPVHRVEHTIQLKDGTSASFTFYMKREDMSSNLYGGNKVRTLEFQIPCAVLGVKREGKAGKVYATGAVGSNQAVAFQAHAARVVEHHLDAKEHGWTSSGCAAPSSFRTREAKQRGRGIPASHRPWHHTLPKGGSTRLRQSPFICSRRCNGPSWRISILTTTTPVSTDPNLPLFQPVFLPSTIRLLLATWTD